ncbi:MAG: 2-polyprenylphenol 6-hydroxylase [Pseudomonadota bacterium]|nr:2-polyprenylphenol 6-hydroxylase [Pseudomonadota bacterium]
MSLGVVHGLRLVRVLWSLSRHGALFPLQAFEAPGWLVFGFKFLERKKGAERPGSRLASALQVLGPTFVKLGQSLAVRGDLIGDDVADDLSALHDDLPPFSSLEAIATIERELNCDLEQLFSHFDEVPTAAASIAQVHFAERHDGVEVAVKVLRPGIEDDFARDIDFFRWIANLVEKFFPAARRLKPRDVVRSFEETVRLEMDLRLEAAAAGELAENFSEDAEFRVPLVDWERTSRRVLTLERVDGIPIDEIAKLEAAGIVPCDLLARSARIFFNQVFRDGFFHADMHPGNMFVAADGVLSPVDFGIMGRLDRKTRYFLADMLIAFLERDYMKVAEVHFTAGYVPSNKSLGAFAQACRAIAEPILGKSQNEISIARLLGQLFHVTHAFEMETQPQLLLLQKTMLVAEGVGRKLDSESNMWVLAEPLIVEWMHENRGPEARLRDLATEVARGVERLPHGVLKLAALSEMVTAGGLKLHPHTVEALNGASRNGFWGWLGWVALGILVGLLIGANIF